MKETLHVSIGGCFIQIIFHDTVWKYSKNRLVQDIYRWYTPFFINPHKPDVKVNIKWNDRIGLLTTGQGRVLYSPLCRYNSRTEVTCYYHSSITEFNFAVSSVLNRLFVRRPGFFIHASSIIVHDKAVLFMGESGAGKSTAVGFLKGKYIILSDDVLAIRKEEGRYFAYQTPFVEKNHRIRKQAGRWPVSHIYRVKQANAFKTDPLKDKTAMIDIVTGPKKVESGIYEKQYRTIIDFLNRHPIDTLQFKLDRKEFVRFFRSIVLKEKGEE